MPVVLIPAYEPDVRLVALVRALRGADATRPVVVVDDGSGGRYQSFFVAAAASGAVVVAHPRNRGKGAALKTGFAEIARRFPGADVITADCDGQHTPADIERVAARTAQLARPQRCVGDLRDVGREPADAPDEAQNSDAPAIVLGVREFDVVPVPLRSRVGNTVTRWVFQAVAGQRVQDTQTGLRGFPAATLPWLQRIPGDRFEYEFRMLLHARSAGVTLVEQPIATVYTDGNASSHFRPVADSLRIYAPIARFAASAILAFVLDTMLLLGLHALTGWLLFSVVAARIVSASANYAVNRRLVFRRGRDVPLRTSAARYFSLAALLLAANYGTITALTDAGIPLLAAKLLTEATLFLVSFSVQRAIVFAAPPTPQAPATSSRPTHISVTRSIPRG